MKVSVEVTGSERLREDFRRLAGDEKNRVLIEAIDEGLRRIRSAAGAKAPIRAGYLVANIRIDGPRVFDDAVAGRVLSGPRDGKRDASEYKQFNRRTGQVEYTDAFYSPWVEYGHKVGRRGSNESIGRKKRKRRTASEALAIDITDRARTDVPPQPFMRPAADENAEAVHARIDQQLWEHLQSVWNR